MGNVPAQTFQAVLYLQIQTNLQTYIAVPPHSSHNSLAVAVLWVTAEDRDEDGLHEAEEWVSTQHGCSWAPFCGDSQA